MVAVVSDRVELGECPCGRAKWESVRATVSADGSLEVEATCCHCGAPFGAPARPAVDRHAEICRAHFVNGESVSALASRWFLTNERVEEILRPVRVMRDNAAVRAVLAEMESGGGR